jgi:signal peptidase
MTRIESLAVAAVLALLIAAITLDLSGHQLLVVTGASMEPAVAKGSLVVVRPTIPAALAVGDVVTFQHKGETVTHRIAAIGEYGDARVFTTKGDANAVADPEQVSFEDRAGLLVAQLPLAGYALGLLGAYGRIAALLLALLVAAWAVRERRARPFPLPSGA